MAAKNYRVRIARGDQQFEAEGDKAFVLKMLERFESKNDRTPTLLEKVKGKALKSSPAGVAALASSKSVSAGEFIRQFGFKKHTDLVLAFGYYLEQHSDVKEFTAADINNCYYEAKMEPSNTSQAIILNIRRSCIMEARAKGKGTSKGVKKYTLTATGESYISKSATKATDLD